jgi:ADP-ribose diphosphatase
MKDDSPTNSSSRRKPTLLHSELIASTRFFRIEQRDLQFSNGIEVSYERLVGSGNGAVLVVPMLDESTVILIREYAAGVHRYELALPKGKVEPEEPLLDAANREIMEEIGYGARTLSHLASLTVAPGYLSHETHIILAEDLYEQKHQGDEPEDIEVVPWKLEQLPELLAHEECTEARSIAALFMVKEHLAQRTGKP